MEKLVVFLSFLFVFALVVWKGWKDLEEDSFNISPCGRVCKYTLLVLFFPVVYGEDIVNFFRGGWIREKKKKALQEAEKEKYTEHIREFIHDLLGFLNTIESEELSDGKLKEPLDAARETLAKEHEPYFSFDGTLCPSGLASDMYLALSSLGESEKGMEILSRLLEHLKMRPVPIHEYNEVVGGLYCAKLKYFERNSDESLNIARQLATFLKTSGLADPLALYQLAYVCLYHHEDDALKGQISVMNQEQKKEMEHAQSKAWEEISAKYREEGKYEDAYSALQNVTHSTLDALYEAGALMDALDVTDLRDLKKEVVWFMEKRLQEAKPRDDYELAECDCALARALRQVSEKEKALSLLGEAKRIAEAGGLHYERRKMEGITEALRKPGVLFGVHKPWRYEGVLYEVLGEYVARGEKDEAEAALDVIRRIALGYLEEDEMERAEKKIEKWEGILQKSGT